MESILTAIRKVDILNSKLKSGHPVDSSIIAEIKSEVSTLDEQVSSECKDQQELWQSTCMVLKELICKFTELVATCLQKMKGVEEEFEALKLTLQKLEGEIMTLNHKVEEMNVDSHKLVLGQIAYEIDKAVVSYVLNEIVEPNHYINTIKDMESAIRGNESNYADVLATAERRLEAEDRWRELKEKLHWNPRHFRYMKLLKQHRIGSAHPPIDKAKVEAALENNLIPELEKKIYQELFHMFVELKTLVA